MDVRALGDTWEAQVVNTLHIPNERTSFFAKGTVNDRFNRRRKIAFSEENPITIQSKTMKFSSQLSSMELPMGFRRLRIHPCGIQGMNFRRYEFSSSFSKLESKNLLN
ncbi:hypothetical protein TNCV_630181 [Trichonephila clavipes]|nr:hypothetical protein TNCV_630181 [Trichonephila clavipes]